MAVQYILLTLFFILCVIISGYGRRKQMEFLVFSLVVYTLLITFRDASVWSDTRGYMTSFKFYTKNLYDFSFHDTIVGYTERGFYMIGVVVKTFTRNERVYLFVVAAISMVMLFTDLRRYAVYPLMALCLYMARFGFGRHFVQIRAGLAILMVIAGMRYVTNRQLWHYLAVVVTASFFHASALIALPAYFLNSIALRKKHVVIILVVTWIMASVNATYIRKHVTRWSVQTEMAQSYTNMKNTQKSVGRGLHNPMLIYQSTLLLLLTFSEGRVRNQTPHYITLRNGYLYSTVWLILLSEFHVLSARGSTITATYECFFLPLFFGAARGNERIISVIALYLYAVIWLTINMNK